MKSKLGLHAEKELKSFSNLVAEQYKPLIEWFTPELVKLVDKVGKANHLYKDYSIHILYQVLGGLLKTLCLQQSIPISEPKDK